ncbi:uncharacterized protein K460DRAFT_202512 [Cucurbitaria berberidis CBS 394.84]|uniref:Uncharacterized protein n=1 Tax=Cucurbitaria berberidis CBS 394.84 TaxID=1168544 RepID=A0A9P4L2X2_9PLEO|nr:uncharacterized protein K460DRAFT_202512 [Cucurbitaria berberidis CBS 394.84]KAF1840111.1 hypothetical protein K460DRAFT_202512 [Cucurbitaria berberidis CBS 394.84]
MPSFVTRSLGRTDHGVAHATSVSAQSQIILMYIRTVSLPVCAMQSSKQGQAESSSKELETLVSKLKGDTLQQFARTVEIQSSYITFNVERHTEIITYMKNNSESTFSHVFGAVLGPGTTVFSGPYSYTIVVVDSVDRPEYVVGGKDPGNSILFHGPQGLAVEVKGGRLVSVVFGWKK